ncbi:uncharacterized protein ppp1r3ab isoform X2 [Mastacembelus armatus]|uniref:Protein phosphatase 1, regulatory subunit 3Ab n=1 Tax=Mastacembelus armatus TaxID=205130 RepID=A0A3Q3NEH3_9TELE|nr:uncharacterized protein LOC113133378 isoform X2 [Mastacembelus armatus]
MLNVSCQKQEHCSLFPADSLTESPMEFAGQPRPFGVCNLLEVPGLSSFDVDDDEGEVVIGIRPKSSPLPRRRSSVTDEDSEPEPPLCGSRRVSFADAKGLNLVQVKEFDTWDVPKLPGYDFCGEGKEADEYFLSPLTFSVPLSSEELFVKVQDQKVELETIELIPGTTVLKGVIRVLNISFTKAVYVRTTLDTWSSHFDLLAEYIPGSSDGQTDGFSFKLTLVPPFGEQGARVDFCLRYETPVGTFWANNNNRNFILFCHRRIKEQKEKPQKDNVNKKSCLKTVSQNLSSVENISSMEGSSEENIPTVAPKQEEEANIPKAEQIFDEYSVTSEDREKTLQTENKQNSSQRSRRKAVQMARVRDYFAQRNEGVDEPGRDDAAQDENPVEKHSNMQSFSEVTSKSDGSLFVSESLETCSEPLLEVLHDTSQAHDYTSNSEPEKSENNSLPDSATSQGECECASDISDKPLLSNEEPVSTEHENINFSLSKTEGKSQKPGMIYECTTKAANELGNSAISAVSNQGPVSQTSSFTFGTVVAPLYHQVFGRMDSENQSTGGSRKPVGHSLNAKDLTHINHHTDRRESSDCAIAKDTKNNMDKIQENWIKTEEPNQKCFEAILNSRAIEKGEETSLSVTANSSLEHADTPQDLGEIIHSDQKYTDTCEAPKPISVDTDVHLHTVDSLNVHVLNTAAPKENLYLQEEAQEDDVTSDFQSQAIAESEEPQHKCSQTKTTQDQTLVNTENNEVMSILETSFLPLQPPHSTSEYVCDDTDQEISSNEENKSNKENDIDETTTIIATNTISQEDRLLGDLHDLNPTHIYNSATAKETANNIDSCHEMVQENGFTAPKTSLETPEKTNNVDDQNIWMNNLYEDKTKHSGEVEVGEEGVESMTKADHMHGDMFAEFKDRNTLKHEPIILSEKIAHHEIEAKMKVQEDEKNIFIVEEKSEAIDFQVEDTEAVDTEDTGIESTFENGKTKKEETKEELMEEILSVGGNVAENADVLEDKQSTERQKTGEIVGGSDREAAEKEYVQVVQMETTAAEKELSEETEVEKTEEQEEMELAKEKHFNEMQDVSIERTYVHHEEEIEAEEMEIDLKNEEAAGVDWENEAEENSDYKEEMLFDEARETDDVSFLVNNGQDKVMSDKENTGKGQNTEITTGMPFYKEEDFQSNENVTSDHSESETESAAADGCSQIVTHEPENDQTSHDSSSGESDSDDEVELYMHCLKAVHTGAQVHKDRNKETGFPPSKRSSVSRSQLLPTPMPPISESLDEEQHLSSLQDHHEDMETTDTQRTAAPLSVSSGQEGVNKNASWWKETFSYSSGSKPLLYSTLFLVFLVVAYHYDFLACFGLYLLSVVWLCCQGERQPVKKNDRVG